MPRKNQAANAQPTEKTIGIASDGSVKVADAALILGVTSQTIRNWLDAGAPVVAAGGQGRGNVTRVIIKDILAWREATRTPVDADVSDYDEARARAADWHYRAIKREAEARQELGSLIPVDVLILPR